MDVIIGVFYLVAYLLFLFFFFFKSSVIFIFIGWHGKVAWINIAHFLNWCQTISYMAKRVVGTGSFGVVFQVTVSDFYVLWSFHSWYCSWFGVVEPSDFFVWCRPSAWRQVKLLPSRRCCRIRDTRIENSKLCAYLTILM